MRGSVQIITPFTSFAHDLRDQLSSLGYEVTLSFETPLRCRALYRELRAQDEPLWEALAPLQLSRRQHTERTVYTVTLELGGAELLTRASSCQLTLEGPNIELQRRLERRLEPLGLGGIHAHRAHPTQALIRYGGAPRAVLAITAWYLAREGYSTEWIRLWGLHDMELMVSIPEVSSDRPAPSGDPSGWQITLECDDHALSEELIKRLSLAGFIQINAQLMPLEEHIGSLVSWGPLAPSDLLKLALWGAVSDAERCLLGGEATYPRCELMGGSLEEVKGREALSLSLQPSLTLRVARGSATREAQAQRAQALAQGLELCLRSEMGALSEVARLLRALKPRALQVLTQAEWEERCELLTLLDDRAYPAELPQLGVIWGEIRCSRSLAPLGAWLQDQLLVITQRRPSLVCTSSLSPRELWVLLPRGL